MASHTRCRRVEQRLSPIGPSEQQGHGVGARGSAHLVDNEAVWGTLLVHDFLGKVGALPHGRENTHL